MNGALLGFKYDRIPVSTSYSGKKLIQLGWKCRKYQKWEQVHYGDDCRIILKDFGDAAIDQGVLRFDLFSTINTVLLNVEKWRLDKQNLSVEPRHYESWDHADIVLKTCQERPIAALNYLHEQYDLSDGLNIKKIYEYVAKHMIILIFQDSLDVDLDFSLKLSDFDHPIAVLVGRLFKSSGIPNEIVTLLECPSVKDILKLLDLPYRTFSITEEDFSSWDPKSVEKMVCLERAMEGYVTARMEKIKGQANVYFNTNNNCFKFAKTSFDTDEMYKKMVEANILALQDLSLEADLISDIQEMWGMKIDRLFRGRIE